MWLDMEWKEKTSIAQDAINVCERNPNHCILWQMACWYCYRSDICVWSAPVGGVQTYLCESYRFCHFNMISPYQTCAKHAGLMITSLYYSGSCNIVYDVHYTMEACLQFVLMSVTEYLPLFTSVSTMCLIVVPSCLWELVPQCLTLLSLLGFFSAHSTFMVKQSKGPNWRFKMLDPCFVLSKVLSLFVLS